jgi:hypothetical protein
LNLKKLQSYHIIWVPNPIIHFGQLKLLPNALLLNEKLVHINNGINLQNNNNNNNKKTKTKERKKLAIRQWPTGPQGYKQNNPNEFIKTVCLRSIVILYHLPSLFHLDLT